MLKLYQYLDKEHLDENNELSDEQWNDFVIKNQDYFADRCSQIARDLFIDNIFFYKKKFYGFIDFYFSSNDFEAYELATCINALCFNQIKKRFFYDKNKTLQLLNGYESIRKLNKKEKNSLNILCKGSDTVIVR